MCMPAWPLTGAKQPGRCWVPAVRQSGRSWPSACIRMGAIWTCGCARRRCTQAELVKLAQENSGQTLPAGKLNNVLMQMRKVCVWGGALYGSEGGWQFIVYTPTAPLPLHACTCTHTYMCACICTQSTLAYVHMCVRQGLIQWAHELLHSLRCSVCW
jgi:hypothetical protein